MTTSQSISHGHRGRDQRRTQAERRATTQAALLESARDLFAEYGFAGTGLEQVAARAGVTRGALYHHFETKADLFAAVVEEVDEEFAAEAMAAAQDSPDVASMILQGARAYIDVCARSDNNRILADVVSVLGPEAYHAISSARCLSLLHLAIDAADAGGASVLGDRDVLAAMLLGALNEAVLYLTRDPGSEATRDAVARTVDAVLERLLLDR